MSQKEEKRGNERGITLIALVVTIIVLLILAGITISTLVGENVIITKAIEAREKTEIAEVKERVQLDILGEQAKGTGSGITAGKLQEILGKYFTEESIPENANESWSGNTKLQIRYYNFLQTNEFVDGNANN